MHRGGRRPSGATIDLRDRVVANNQLLLTAIVGGLFVVGFATQSLRNPELFGLGVLVIVVGAGASLAVPWTRIAPAWVAIIPLVDIGAIALLRASDPSGGLGLLWAFPVLWLSSLGRGAFLLSSVLVTAVYWVVVATSGATERTYAHVLLPMLMFAIGWARYSATRRSSAQRVLLDRQTDRLSAALAQANRQEQLVTEVLDTVDFGVIRIDASGAVTHVNDALGAFRLRIPGFGRVDEDLVSYREDGLTLLSAAERPLARALRGEEFSDVIVQAAAIYRGCVDELSGLDRGLLPQVGVGVALTETLGYDAEHLLASARLAAGDAAHSVEASVLFGGVSGSRPAHR